jgi:hypothetical protein
MLRAVLGCLLLGGCGSCTESTQASVRIDAAAPLDAAIKDAASEAEAGPPPQASFDDFPDAGPADLDVRGKHLLEAIAQNDPSLAADIMMPREAYITARDAQDPAALYESKFKTSIATHIAHIHKKEKGVENAVYVSFDLGQSTSRVVPKKHEWKEPLWHATRSTLTFTIDGRVQRVEIAEMVAWRGNWYVAKLH